VRVPLILGRPLNAADEARRAPGVVVLGDHLAAGMGGGEAGTLLVLTALMRTSAVMLVVGLLACVEPGARALTIDPTTARRDG
jgi:hypothetical protein